MPDGFYLGGRRPGFPGGRRPGFPGGRRLDPPGSRRPGFWRRRRYRYLYPPPFWRWPRYRRKCPGYRCPYDYDDDYY